MADKELNTLLALNPNRLKQNLGLVLPKPTQEYSNNVLVKRLPCFGRIHFVRDREGILFLSGVIAYWLYGILGSYYCVVQPQYQDGRLPAWAVYYHLAVAFLCLLTLLRAATLNPGRVPFSEEDFNNLESKKIEMCQRCLRPKPPRAHHCRRCQQCVMKMDHHCPWINNCVGEANHHVFVLLLFYALLFSANTLIFMLLNFWVWPKCQLCDHMWTIGACIVYTGIRLLLLICPFDVFYIKHGIWFQYLCTVMACVMGFGMSGMFFTQHWNVTRDTTTLETMKTQGEQTSSYTGPYLQRYYYKSIFKGYSDLFGTKLICLWLFPCRRKPSSAEGNMLHV